MKGRVGVFLDRDGTINEEVDFVRTPAELHMINGAAEAIRRLNQRNVVTCVISNQSGIARGILTEETLARINERLEQELRDRGAYVDRIYYCPHHPTEGVAPYDIECDCRKPAPGMLLRGEREFGLDLTRSFVVGDSRVDVLAANSVGAASVLVQTGYGRKALAECMANQTPVGHVAASITDAVDYILKHLNEEDETYGE
jgi:D-glycero-D-manno-heptose 1,7-bisphosphate phosphatase